MRQGIASNRNMRRFTEIAEQAGRMWGLSGSPVLLTKSENIVYEMQGQILRLTENHHRSAAQLNAELDFISTLWDGGVSVAKPQISINGLRVETIDNHHISIFEKAEGTIENAELTFSSLRATRNLGLQLGKIHSLSVSFSSKDSKRHHFSDVMHLKNGLQSIPAEDQLAITEFKKGVSWLNTLPKDKNVYGLVHMDAHNRNFSIDTNENITLFDFDDCAYNFFAYDLATPLYSIQRSSLSIEQKQEARNALLDGYSEAYSLPDTWLDTIDGFIRFRDIEMFAWCCYMFGAPKNKEGGNISYVNFNPPFKRIADDFTKPYPVLY